MKRRGTMWMAVSAWIFASACADAPREWTGWLDFNSDATYKSAICNGTSLEYGIDKLGDDDGTAVRSHLSALGHWPAFEKRITCIDRADDCDEYLQCLIQGAQACGEGPFEERCDGDVAVTCSYMDTPSDQDNYVRETDCSSVPGGGQCVIEDSSPTCRFTQCAQETENPRCEGDLALFCEEREGSFIYWAQDCALVGLACIPPGHCSLPGAINCDGESYHEICEGPYIHGCTPAGAYSANCHEIHPDFVCYLDEYDESRCGMPQGLWECEEHGRRWCEGSLARACVRGKIISFDCASFADASCLDGDCIAPEEK